MKCSLFAMLLIAMSMRFGGAGDPTMKAIVVHEFGPPSVMKVEEVSKPTPGEGEMLVRVHAAAVNPVDAGVRSGRFKGMSATPFTPGYDVAGVVDSVGPGVTAFKKGEEVMAYLDLRRGGAYAEYAIVKAGEAAAKPKNAGFSQAAAVPLTGLTAWQALFDAAKLEKGQSVLIHGGAGGVGTMAVQLAKWKGARVYATASTEHQAALRELGVDVPIDYTKQKFEEVARDVDVVLDTVGGETQARSLGALKKGGVLVSIVGPVPREKAEAAGVRGASILVKPDGAELAKIGELVESGAVKPVVSAELPLDQAPKAHEMIESKHTRGKIVLTP